MYKIKFLILAFIFPCFLHGASKKTVEKTAKICSLPEAEQRRFDYFFYEGLRHKNNNEFDQAIEAFRLCETLDSLDAGVQSELGILYAGTGFTVQAVNSLEKALKTDPSNWWYNVQLINMYMEQKNWKRSIELVTNLQKLYPNREEVYTLQASLYKETRQFDKAIAAYEKLESMAGISQALALEKFQLYILLNNKKKGIAEIDKLVAKYPSESRYKVFRGDIFLQQNMPQQAFDIYQQVLKDDPQNAVVYVSLSNYFNSVNQPEKAMEAIMNALKNEHLDLDSKIQVLGQYVEKMVRDSSRLSETESLFRLLVDRYPTEEQVHGYYAMFLQLQRRNAEAISELESMLNINAKNEQSWLRLIQIYLGDKNFKQIVALSDRAILTLPKSSALYFYRGIAQFQLEQYPEALLSYKTGLPFIANNQNDLKSDFYAQIADVYFKVERKDSAFVNYEKSLAANPRNIMVMNNYAYYLSLEKAELKKAERMSAKTVELEPKNSTYLDTYAWILYQQGSFTLAKYYIERAVDNMKKEEESSVILEHYGDILWATKNDDKALKMWQKSLETGNKSDDLKKKIENKGWKR